MTQNATTAFHAERNPMILGYSGIADFLTCRQRWRLKYVYGLSPKVGFRAMDLGTAVHEGLAHWLAGYGTVEEGVRTWVERTLITVPADMDLDAGVEEIGRDALVVATRAVEEIVRRDLRTVYLNDQPAVELELKIDFDGWDGFASHLDWIAFDPKTSQVWIVDFKSRKSFYGADSEDVNLQNMVYQHMAAMYGIESVGTLMFQIASAAPKVPKVNKDGTVSRSAIATDWETYQAAVIAAGQDPADYLDMRGKLEGSATVSLIEAFRSPDAVARAWEKIVVPVGSQMAIARDLLMSESSADRTTGADATPRNLGQRTCNGCAVRDVCLASLKGWDLTSPLRDLKVHPGRKDLIVQAAREDIL